MAVYVFVTIMIIFLGFFYEFVKSKNAIAQKRLSDILFVIPSFILLFTISAFRGDFATDYNNYVHLFEEYNRFGFFEVFQAGFKQEIGYVFLSRFIGVFTRNEVYIFIAVSFITLLCFYSQFRKYSAHIWLSVLLFVAVGAFYTSFNIMRHILAVAIIFAGSKFLYERKLLKYFLVVALAALFHSSSLVMLVFYFILNFKFSTKNLIFIFSGAVVTMLYLENIITIVQRVIYSEYTSTAYGMTGVSYKNALIPVVILMFCLFHYKKIDLNNTIHKIWINSVIFYAFFSVLGVKIQMIQRISEFFSPYALLLIPLIISKMKNNALKGIWVSGLVFLLFLYSYYSLNNTGYDPYYTFWSLLD